MPKLSSSSNPTTISSRQLSKPPVGMSPRIHHDLPACACCLSTARTASSSRGGMKKRGASSRRAKRRRPRSNCAALLVDLHSSCSSLQIPNGWGAKRARTGDPPFEFEPNPIPPSFLSTRRDWANLGDGPAGLIAELLLAHDVADYVSFRDVCRRWRQCCADPRAHGVLDRRFHPRHWVMLRTEAVGGRSSSRRAFINIATGRCRHVDLPELRGQEVFGPTAEGLLVLLDRATYTVRLLNPFTRHTAALPPVTPLLSNLESLNARSFDVSGAGLADGGDSGSTVAVYFEPIRTLAIAKPGDEHWTVVDQGRLLWPALSFAGRFYCATATAVMVLETTTTTTGTGGADDDVHSPPPPRLAVAAELARPISRFRSESVHLVDNDGELMLVDRECNFSRKPTKHWVYRVDLDAGKMVPVSGLSGRAVFIGVEMALSVSPLVFPSISADTIYLGFDDLLRGPMDKSPVYPMDVDGTAEPCASRMLLTHCGPRGVDEYLSWCVTGYRHGSEASEW